MLGTSTAARGSLLQGDCGEPSGSLFPAASDLLPTRPPVAVQPNIVQGPFSSHRHLLKTHVDLLTEDFLRALNEQMGELHKSPERLNSAAYYRVRGGRIQRDRRGREIGIELNFDASKYRDVTWEEEKGMMHGNLVFLTSDSLRSHKTGLIVESGSQLLRSGCVVIKLCSRDSPNGILGPAHQELVSKDFHLIESDVFYFPYLHVTNTLRRDMRSPLEFQFEQELVKVQLPARSPRYYGRVRCDEKMSGSIAAELTESQAQALNSIFTSRVALIQGPPGTGKTFLGTKIAEYFVALRNAHPYVLRGPILVVTTTNHAVDEFLQRCCVFTDKIIHGYGSQHQKSAYGKLQSDYDKASSGGQLALMKKADILAMTTTRGAYMRDTLDKLGIKIVLVEEAAEALEGYVLACIPEEAEHLIMIGDHKQLRPNASHSKFAAESQLDISLFERLIRNGAHCPMLNEQRRMRPEVSRLVACIYPSLRDHSSTADRPPIAGVREPVYFLDHQEPEAGVGDSFSNQFEARMAAELCRYLLLQDYKPGEITVLTTYRRQLGTIVQHMRNVGGDVRRVRVTTVDSFQGEENLIIILSLVRSNNRRGIGFMKQENRACVALSRARDGFFILGNMTCFAACGVPVWQHVNATLSEAGLVGPSLPLCCPHGKKFDAKSADEVQVAGLGCVLCQVQWILREATRAVEEKNTTLADTRANLEACCEALRNVESQAEKEEMTGRLQKLKKSLTTCEEERARLALAETAARKKCADVELLRQQGMVNVDTDTMLSVEVMLTHIG